MKKTEERLWPQLGSLGLGAAVQAQWVVQAARRMGVQPLLVVDITALRPSDAQAMGCGEWVRDGSRGEWVAGYWCGVALGWEAGSRWGLPLRAQLGSGAVPDFVGQKAHRMGILDGTPAATGGRGIDVWDRGGDRFRTCPRFWRSRVMKWPSGFLGCRPLITMHWRMGCGCCWGGLAGGADAALPRLPARNCASSASPKNPRKPSRSCGDFAPA